jgi:hypothetical protein
VKISATSRIIVASLLFLLAGRAALAPGQSIIASVRPDPTATSFQFAQIDIDTGLSTPISPLGPNAYVGLGATASGQVYGVHSNQLWQIDLRECWPSVLWHGIHSCPGTDYVARWRHGVLLACIEATSEPIVALQEHDIRKSNGGQCDRALPLFELCGSWPKLFRNRPYRELNKSKPTDF